MRLVNIIKKKSKLTSKDLQYVMDMLFSRITVFPKDEYADYYVQAKDIMKILIQMMHSSWRL